MINSIYKSILLLFIPIVILAYFKVSHLSKHEPQIDPVLIENKENQIKQQKLNEEISKRSELLEKEMLDKKWKLFFDYFIESVNSRYKPAIERLTSKKFFDGGGGYTLDEWLDNFIFINAVKYDDFKRTLQCKISDFKTRDGKLCKATGNMEYGDLYFIYENDEWLFAGVVGD